MMEEEKAVPDRVAFEEEERILRGGEKIFNHPVQAVGFTLMLGALVFLFVHVVFLHRLIEDRLILAGMDEGTTELVIKLLLLPVMPVTVAGSVLYRLPEIGWSWRLALHGAIMSAISGALTGLYLALR